MFRERIVISILVVLLLVLSGSAMAPTSDTVFCGDLSAALCPSLQEARGAMTTLEAAGFDFELNFEFSGLPAEPGPESIAFGIAGEGAGAVNLSALMDLESSMQEALA